MKIDRYDIWNDWEVGVLHYDLEAEGEWVKYDDHKDIVDALEARIQELQDKLEFDIDDLK